MRLKTRRLMAGLHYDSKTPRGKKQPPRIRSLINAHLKSNRKTAKGRKRLAANRKSLASIGSILTH